MLTIAVQDILVGYPVSSRWETLRLASSAGVRGYCSPESQKRGYPTSVQQCDSIGCIPLDWVDCRWGNFDYIYCSGVFSAEDIPKGA